MVDGKNFGRRLVLCVPRFDDGRIVLPQEKPGHGKILHCKAPSPPKAYRHPGSCSYVRAGWRRLRTRYTAAHRI